jgi:hypothetical protein
VQRLNFDFPLDLTQAPPTYENASITNMFYWDNVVHDISFLHGFDEAAGNFQFTNYSGQGLGNDHILADAQDAFNLGALNNAFFGTPPDGISGFMGMFLWNQTTPNRDGALDGSIVVHEVGHGISNRLTGGPANAGALQALQSGGMGEGWSDWLAVLLTANPTDTRNTPRSLGNWVLGQQVNGPGIRRFPYSSDMSINPLTFGNFNGGFPNNQVHNAGELWSLALLEVTWNLIEKYGFSDDLYTGNGGQNIAMRLVLDGMKLQPSNPSFLQARNAIIAADVALTGGDNFLEIWTGFAKRGFGFSARDGGTADSEVVTEAFDLPPLPARVEGIVYHDINGNGVRNPGEPPLEGWVVYVDANNNGQLDAGERQQTTGADGAYSFLFIGSGQVTIREIVMPDWRQTAPTSNNGAHRVNVSPNQVIAGRDFGNQEIPGEIHGLKFNDVNGNGVRDPGEPGIEGVVIFVDVNNNGRIGVLEPAAVTDRNGRYTILNVPPGSYTVREVFQPGMIQTFPDPQGANGGAHVDVVVVRNQITPNINFGNQAAFDFGDAPTAAQSGFPQSYPTLIAQNGASHGILPGFGLGPAGPGLVVPSANGQPHPQANADPGDNGVTVVGLTPGEMATAVVQVQTGGFSSGLLQGWIDWNRDGDWNDPGERIITDRRLGTGTHTIQFAVPASATLGPVYARFRYGYETGLGPDGSALAGEVEDYVFDVLANIPVARDDFFGASFGTAPIPQGSANHVLDVLANDFGVTVGGVFFPPQIDLATLPATSVGGGTIAVQFNSSLGRNVLVYTPDPSDIGTDTFTYRVAANGILSAFATVTIDITAGDPRALDDTFTVPFTATPGMTVLDVLRNDVFPHSDTRIVSVQSETIGFNPNTLQIASGGQFLNFTPPAGFRGTIIYNYTIDDNDPNTNPSSARLAVQVVDVVGVTPQPAATHLAELEVRILDTNLNDASVINQGDEFLVLLTARDLRPGNANELGVLAAYIDLLFDRRLAEPVLDATNPRGFDIQFLGDYDLLRRGAANSPAPGIINEVGALFDLPIFGEGGGTPLPPGPVADVFLIRMRATGTGTLQIKPDPAESPATGILLFVPSPDPVNPQVPLALTDEQVFLRQDSVQIVGAGEGEFTNLRNPLDVSNDGLVSPLDALIVINDMNANGPRSLSQFSFATSGLLPPEHFLDVNADSRVSPLDALIVINHLNAMYAATLASGGSGEGEAVTATFDEDMGEGESAPYLGGYGSDLALQDQALQSLLGETAGGIDAPANDGTALSSFDTAVSRGAPVPVSAVDADESDEGLGGSSAKSTLEEAADALFASLGLAGPLEQQ